MALCRKGDGLRRLARMLSLAAVLGFVSFSACASAEEDGEAPETANACVSFRNEAGDKELRIDATNDCKLRLSCHLDYTVRCISSDEQGKEKETSRSHKIAPFVITPKGKATVTLSAAACKQGWAIDDFSWTCS